MSYSHKDRPTQRLIERAYDKMTRADRVGGMKLCPTIDILARICTWLYDQNLVEVNPESKKLLERNRKTNGDTCHHGVEWSMVAGDMMRTLDEDAMMGDEDGEDMNVHDAFNYLRTNIRDALDRKRGRVQTRRVY